MRTKTQFLRAARPFAQFALCVAGFVGIPYAYATDLHEGRVVAAQDLTRPAATFPVSVAHTEVTVNDTKTAADVGFTYKAPAREAFCVVYSMYHGGREVSPGRQSERCFTAADGRATDHVMVGTEPEGGDMLLATIVLRDQRIATAAVLLTSPIPSKKAP